MIIALTGTPGTGKTSVAKLLLKEGFSIVDLNKIITDNGFYLSKDKKRNSLIIDKNKINNWIKKTIIDEKLVFIDSHLSHLLKNIDKVIILRCHPNKLKKNLVKKKWKTEKIKENIQAEILDIILCESIQCFSETDIYEIDTTKKSINDVYLSIKEIIESEFKEKKNYKIGKIDWSEQILVDYN